MGQGKRRTRVARRPKKDWDEVLRVTLSQRFRDTNGNRIPGCNPEEIAVMSIEQREALKSEGWLKLPALVTHGPVRYEADKVIECPCVECRTAIEDWRRRTGRM